MTERRPPSFDLAPLQPGSGRAGSGAGRDRGASGRHASAPEFDTPDLDSPALYDGILLRRCCAAVLDFVLVGILSFILWLGSCTAAVFTLGLLSIPAFLVAPIVIYAILATFMIAGANNATWGMRAFDLQVAATNGRPIDAVQAFLMVAMFLASISIFFPVLLLGLFLEKSRLLHDLVAGTVVIRRRG